MGQGRGIRVETGDGVLFFGPLHVEYRGTVIRHEAVTGFSHRVREMGFDFETVRESEVLANVSLTDGVREIHAVWKDTIRGTGGADTGPGITVGMAAYCRVVEEIQRRWVPRLCRELQATVDGGGEVRIGDLAIGAAGMRRPHRKRGLLARVLLARLGGGPEAIASGDPDFLPWADLVEPEYYEGDVILFRRGPAGTGERVRWHKLESAVTWNLQLLGHFLHPRLVQNGLAEPDEEVPTGETSAG
jgi:hypothetical protein